MNTLHDHVKRVRISTVGNGKVSVNCVLKTALQSIAPSQLSRSTLTPRWWRHLVPLWGISNRFFEHNIFFAWFARKQSWGIDSLENSLRNGRIRGNHCCSGGSVIQTIQTKTNNILSYCPSPFTHLSALNSQQVFLWQLLAPKVLWQVCCLVLTGIVCRPSKTVSDHTRAASP